MKTKSMERKKVRKKLKPLSGKITPFEKTTSGLPHIKTNIAKEKHGTKSMESKKVGCIWSKKDTPWLKKTLVIAKRELREGKYSGLGLRRHKILIKGIEKWLKELKLKSMESRFDKEKKEFGKVLRENVENAVGGKNAHFDTWGYKNIMTKFQDLLKANDKKWRARIGEKLEKAFKFYIDRYEYRGKISPQDAKEETMKMVRTIINQALDNLLQKKE